MTRQALASFFLLIPVIPGCLTLSLGPGSRAHPEYVNDLLGISSLAVSSDQAIVKSSLAIETLDGRYSQALSLERGAGFKAPGFMFNCSMDYRFVETRDGRAIFDTHESWSSCLQPSPTHHTFSVISVAPYGDAANAADGS
jgi:hypothetical protein